MAVWTQRRPWYRHLRRILGPLLVILLGLAVLGLLAIYIFARQSLPEYSGSHTVQGIAAPVAIRRDAHAIPHISGSSDSDVFFGLGYAHAQDRLWQMLLNRATVQGRLAERLGARALPLDRRMRTLGLAQAAARDLAVLSAEGRQALAAYAAGVNARLARLATHPIGRGAPELLIFGGRQIEHWRPVDSLGVVKLMAFRLAGAWHNEVHRARLAPNLPPERLADLIAPDDPGLHTALPRSSGSARVPRQFADAATADNFAARLATLLAGPGASNAFAVSGARSATRMPLLAADPHLGYSAPSIWYLARLELENGGVIGATIPGLPAVIIGRNAWVGWGLTTAYADDQDLYLEQLHPENAGQYRTESGWEPLLIREEIIRDSAGNTHVLTRMRTRNGVVLPAELFELEDLVPAGHLLVLRWTATDAPERGFDGALPLMRARSLDAALAAVAHFGSPAQNFTLASQTEIALVTSGRVPLRSRDHETGGTSPAPGWEPRNAWLGFVSPDQLPRIIRPESGVVLNANTPVARNPFPLHVGTRYPPPYREQRLTELLDGREFHTQQSFRAAQNDDISAMAHALLPIMAAGLWEGDAGATDPPSALRTEALRQLQQWNGRMGPNFPEPLIFSAWFERLVLAVASDEIGALAENLGGQRSTFLARVFTDTNGASAWCDIQGTPLTETCQEIAGQALDEALLALAEEHGDDIEHWRWGRAHRTIHRHLPFGYLGPLGRIFNITHESGGGNFTLQRASFWRGDEGDFSASSGAGFRGIFNFAEPSRSQFILATGQSGHFLSPHYDDLSRLWREGEYVPMALDPKFAEMGSVGTLELVPGP